MSFDLLSTLGTFSRSYVNVLVAPSFAIGLVAHALQMYRWKADGMFLILSFDWWLIASLSLGTLGSIHGAMSDLLALAFPVIAVFVTVSASLDYYFGEYGILSP